MNLGRGLSALASVCVYLACVSEDGTTAQPRPTTNDAGSSGNVGTDSGSMSTVDSGMACPENFGECDGNDAMRCETDLRVSSEHCGACGLNCGGVACVAGRCVSQKIVDQRAMPISFLTVPGRIIWQQSLEIYGCTLATCATDPRLIADVNGNPAQAASMPTGSLTSHLLATDGTNFFFPQCANGSNMDCALAACSIAGCKDTSAKVLAPAASPPSRRPLIVMNGGTNVGDPGVYTYHPLDSLYRWAPPLTPGATMQTTVVGYPSTDVVQALATDRNFFFWIDDRTSIANPDGGLYKCPLATGCAGGQEKLLPPPVKHLAVANGIAFSALGNAAASTIVACPISGCNMTGETLATNQAYVSDIAADDKAVYWTTTGSATPLTNTVAGGQVMMCPLPKCAGGPKVVSEGPQFNPMQIALDKDFVYWMNRGAPVVLPATTGTGSIWRRHR